MLRWAALFVVALLCSNDALASLCSKPEVPSCSSQGAPLNNKQMSGCQWQMSAYQADLERYFDCRKREIDSAIKNEEAFGGAIRSRKVD